MAIVERIELDPSAYLEGAARVEARQDQLNAHITKGNREGARVAKRSAREMGDAYARETSRVGKLMGRLKSAIAAAFAGVAFGGALRALIGINSEMERYQATLTTLLGSQEAAAAKLAKVTRLAASTPFELPELVEATVRLESYGIKAETVLTTLGDTASAMGKSIMQVVEALADAQTGEFERLKELGIRAVQEGGNTLLQYTDRQGKEQARMVDRNSREMINATLLSIWNERFAGAMAKRSSTFQGMASNISDLFTRVRQTVGAGLFGELKGDMKALLEGADELERSGALERWGRQAGEALRGFYGQAKRAAGVLYEYGPLLVRLGAVLLAYRAGVVAAGVATQAWAVAQVAARVATLAYTAVVGLLTGRLAMARRAMILLTASMASNPIGLVAVAIAAAAAAWLTFSRNTDEATQSLSDQETQIRRNIGALREMHGAALVAERARLSAGAGAAEREISDARTERGQLKARVREATLRGVNPGLFYGSAEDRAQMVADRARIEELNGIIAEGAVELNRLRRVGGAAEQAIANDLDAQIALVDEQIDALVRRNDISDEERRSSMRALESELAGLEKVRAARERAQAPTPPTGPTRTLSGEDGSAAQLPRVLEDVQRLTARPLFTFSREKAQLADLSRQTDAYRQTIESLRTDYEAGAITQAQRDERISQASEVYLARLRRSYLAVLVPLRQIASENAALAPVLGQVEAAFSQAFAVAEKGGDAAADAVGGIGASAEGVAGKLADLERQMQAALNPEQMVAFARMQAEAARLASTLAELDKKQRDGALTEEQYWAQAEEASAAALGRMKRFTAEIKAAGPVSASFSAAVQSIFGEVEEIIERARKEGEDFQVTLSDVARTLRAVGRIGDVFGGFSGEVEALIGSTADVLDNLQRIQQMQKAGTFSGLAGALPVLGLAAGAVGIGQSILSMITPDREAERAEAERAAEEMKRLREALADNARSIRSSIERMLRGGPTVGADVSGEDVQRAQGQFSSLSGMAAEIARLRKELNNTSSFWPEARNALLDQIRDLEANIGAALPDFLKDLEEAGITDGAFLERFNELLGAGQSYEQIIADLFGNMDLSGALGSFFDQFGQSSESIDGAINSARTFQRIFGAEAPEAMRHFLDFLLNKVPGIEGDLKSKLEEALSLDVSKEEDRDRLKQIVQDLFGGLEAGTLDLGGLSPGQLQEILTTLFGYAEGAGGSGSAGESNSASVQRAITEVQGNAVVQLLELIERNTRALSGTFDPMQGGVSGGFTTAQATSATADLSAIRRNTFRPVAEEGSSDALSWEDYPGATAVQSDALRSQLLGARGELRQIEANTRSRSGSIGRDEDLASMFGPEFFAALHEAMQPTYEMIAPLSREYRSSSSPNGAREAWPRSASTCD